MKNDRKPVALVNIHGDNFGDFLNAQSARLFCEEYLHARVGTLIPSGGVRRWKSLPDLGQPYDADAQPQRLNHTRDILLHHMNVPHSCDRKLAWKTLEHSLRKDELILSVPSGANLGPYKEISFLPPFIAGKRMGAKAAMLFGTVHPSGSLNFDIATRLILHNVAVSIRDTVSHEHLARVRKSHAGPADISALAIAREALSDQPRRRPVVTLILGEAMDWHPRSAQIEGHSSDTGVAGRALSAIAPIAKQHGLQIELLPHSPATRGDQERMQALEGSAEVTFRSDVTTEKEYVENIQTSRLVVSLRYHGVLTSLVVGTPVVALSYEPKTSGLMALHGLSRFCLDVESLRVTNLSETILSCLSTDGLKWRSTSDRVIDQATSAGHSFAQSVSAIL